ncbi:MAG: hypothetical protein M3Z25_22610 [Actinomycetota bacterium]|nr:hypothetical protein [Actinomycetota bacterium]
MNTWTDSGMSEAGMVGAMLALGLRTPPSRRATRVSAERFGVEWSGAEWSGAERSGAERSGAERSGAEWFGAEPAGGELSRHPMSQRQGLYPAPSYPAPSYPSPESKLASDDLAGWTDGFLAGGVSSLPAPPSSWEAGSSIGPSREPSGLGFAHPESTAATSVAPETTAPEPTGFEPTAPEPIGFEPTAPEPIGFEPAPPEPGPVPSAAKHREPETGQHRRLDPSGPGSDALGSLDSSGLFEELSRRGR